MKTGIIVYVTGSKHFQEIDEATLKTHLDLNADKIEVVISGEENCYDIWDAWWNLLVKGMHRIICVAAEFIGQNQIKLTGRQLQLCAY